MKPLIGITCNFSHPTTERDLFKNKRLVFLEQQLASAISKFGGIPLGIPHPGNPADTEEIVARLDGVVLGGGADVAPGSYGAEPHQGLWLGDAYMDEYELTVIQVCREKQLPLLGVCRGCQILNVACGGTLVQDIPTFVPGSRVHRDPEQYDSLTHPVTLIKGSLLHDLYGDSEAWINSVHHQALHRVGAGLREIAHADDGTIEAIQGVDPAWWVLGLQWHPEWIGASSKLLDPAPIFKEFISAAAKKKA